MRQQQKTCEFYLWFLRTTRTQHTCAKLVFIHCLKFETLFCYVKEVIISWEWIIGKKQIGNLFFWNTENTNDSREKSYDNISGLNSDGLHLIREEQKIFHKCYVEIAKEKSVLHHERRWSTEPPDTLLALQIIQYLDMMIQIHASTI